ncbi:MAG TPA: hypothetical protein VF258_04880 [Luteolibacter sp.]
MVSKSKSLPLAGRKPPKSRLAELIPDAIEIRKSTGATWREIARQLSEREGINIPCSSLYGVSITWIKRRRELDELPDPKPTRTEPQGRGVSVPEAVVTPVGTDDFEDTPRKLIVKTRKNQ